MTAFIFFIKITCNGVTVPNAITTPISILIAVSFVLVYFVYYNSSVELLLSRTRLSLSLRVFLQNNNYCHDLTSVML